MRMTQLPSPQGEEHLSHVTQQFAQWRASRPTPHGRIPQPLWAQAIALTQQLPLTRVANQLGLTPQVLKRRREATRTVAGPPPSPCPPHFVEVPAPAWRMATAEVEVQRAAGTRLRITYRDSAPALVPLLQTFLETRSGSHLRPKAASFSPCSPSIFAQALMAAPRCVARLWPRTRWAAPSTSSAPAPGRRANS